MSPPAMSRFRRDVMGVDTHPNDVPDDDDKRPDRSPWEWIDLLTTEKMSLRDAKRLYNFKSYSPRIVNRALVGDARTIDIVDLINQRKALADPEKHYQFLLEFLDQTKHYCKWYFGREDIDLSTLRKDWCSVHERGTSDFYSLVDNRYGLDKMRQDVDEAVGGREDTKGRKKKK